MKREDITLEMKIAFTGFNNAVEVLKSIAHPVSLYIVQELAKTKTLSAKDIQQNLSLPQSIVSHHLNKLKEAGVVDCKKEGRYKVHYLNKIAERQVTLSIK